ncbi:MAG: hypothetical protein CR991_05355 [Proteobacteria bacterium]|nr:MAG: hypothetical protein CR991_05355 [Pseudomonadota bacterium]
MWRDNLSPVERLAWFVIIIFFPYLGVVIYGMFGEIDLGRFINTDASELLISTPYFVPDSLILGALCTTAYRGVDVTLIVPQRNDSFNADYDGQVAFFGSTNLDLRSFDLNYENNILVYDEKVT